LIKKNVEFHAEPEDSLFEPPQRRSHAGAVVRHHEETGNILGFVSCLGGDGDREKGEK
jgi:hypothetical protein